MQGIIQKLQGEFSDDTLPRYYPNDPWIDGGSIFLKDFGKSLSWPSLAAPTNNAPILDLVTGAANGVFSVPGTPLGYRENGIEFSASGTPYIKVGAANTDFSLYALGSPDFVSIVWFKRETGFSTNPYQCLLGRGTSTAANLSEFYINMGPLGDQINIGISNGTNIIAMALTVGAELTAYQALLNTTVQIAIALEGGYVKLFINGVFIKQSASTLAKPLSNYTSQAIFSGYGNGGGAFKGLIKRLGMGKLGYGKTALEKVQQDYNAHKVRLQTPA